MSDLTPDAPPDQPAAPAPHPGGTQPQSAPASSPGPVEQEPVDRAVEADPEATGEAFDVRGPDTPAAAASPETPPTATPPPSAAPPVEPPAAADAARGDAPQEAPRAEAAAHAVPAAPGSAVAAPLPAAAPTASGEAADYGRVAPDGTVYVRTPEGEREVGSYPGASPQEALAYFSRKYDEVVSVADLLYRRVTQTDLSAKDAAEGLAHLRRAVADLRAVGDLVALAARVETIATAIEARRVVENQQREAARAQALARREEIVVEAERLAAQPEKRVQWKSSSSRMRELLEEWKSAQRGGPRLDRESEQQLWHRLSTSRNSFDKMRRVHFAQLGAAQAEAKARKEALVAEAESLSGSTDWGATAGAYKRLMDRWREAGRAPRQDDDALWRRFKAAQDAFFGAKDAVVLAENEEFKGNLAVKESLLAEAQALLPVKDLERTKAALRAIQDRWDAAGKVPRADMDRIEKAMRRVESAVREADDRRWVATNPEVAARAANLAEQAEKALQRYRRDLEKAEASGDERKIAAAREALETRRAWLQQARAGMAEFGR